MVKFHDIIPNCAQVDFRQKEKIPNFVSVRVIDLDMSTFITDTQIFSAKKYDLSTFITDTQIFSAKNYDLSTFITDT